MNMHGNGQASRRRLRGVGIVAGVFILLLIVIAAIHPAGKSTPAANSSASPSATAGLASSPTPNPVKHAKHKAKHKKRRGVTRPSPPPAPAPPPASPPAPRQTPPPASAPPPPATQASCHPVSNEGTCYEPGEYCRKSDHGVQGVAGDGEAIVCEDNNGWRWEPV